MARFAEEDLTDAEFRECVLDRARLLGVVMRGAVIDGWVTHLVVNGVEVMTYVDAELDRRFPGRAERRAATPEGLRSAWAAAERTWATTLDRVAALPAGTVDVSVSGEWSFAQTLRHLVLASDMWLGEAVLGLDDPYHPLGLRDSESEHAAASGAATWPPAYDEVLTARQGRVALVRDFLATVTEAELATARQNPHDPDRPETTLSCLHTILEEEWEHHRFAVRDLDSVEQQDA